MPMFAPTGLNIAVVIPIILPVLSRRGPPEFPGFTAASVWIIPLISRPLTALRVLPIELTMPAVSVLSRPKGFPIAIAFCPTLRTEESPKGIGLSLSGGALIFITARSLLGSEPTILASHLLPSKRVTSSFFAFSTT